MPRIIKALPETRFALLGNATELVSLTSLNQPNVTIINYQEDIYSIQEQLTLVQKIPRESSLLWSPHYNIPIFYGGKLLVTVHDAFHLAMPQYVGGLHKRVYANVLFTAVRKKASAILTDSEFSKGELVRLTGQGKQRIHAIHIGVDSSWFNVKRGDQPFPEPFLLYVGNIKPHKNLSGLLAAFAMIRHQLPHHLVIVGKREGFLTGDSEVAAKAQELNNRVHFTGHVEDKMLRQYFAYAEALILPSFYEGFGLPPLEAMACGCPVVVSNVASLPEVCSDAALYCDPYDPKDIACKVQRLMTEPVLQEELRQKGFERAKLFTWDRCAHETLAVIQQVLNQ